MKNTNINKQILSLALPTLGFMIISPLLLSIDTAFIGRLGSVPLAALSISTLILTTSFSLFIFLTYGTTSQVGKNYGAGNIKQAYFYGLQSIWLSFFIGISVCIFLYFFSYEMFLFLGVTEQVALLANSYVKVSLPGLFSIIISLSCIGILRGMLNNIIPLIFTLIAAVINIFLTGVFVVVFSWGLVGAGIATSISEIIITICLLTIIIRNIREYDIKLFPNKIIFKSLIQNIPLFIRSLTLNASFIAVGFAISSFGTVNVAAHQIVYTVNMCIVLLLDSISIASQSLIAVEMGRKNRETLMILTKKCFISNTVMSVFLGMFIFIFSSIIPKIFTSDEILLTKAILPILFISLLLPVMSFAFIGDGVLIGSGDTLFLAIAGIINFIFYASCLYLISIFVPKDFGLLAVWICMISVFYGGRAIANTYRLFSYKWIKF